MVHLAATFKEATVVGQPEADTAAVNILKKGGNAVDAAVQAALLACVLVPHKVGIGGYGGAMVACVNGELACLDFNTVAPKGAAARMFQVTRADGRFGSGVKDRANELGAQAVSVPAVLAGLSAAQEKLGKFQFADLLAPAIRACQNGFRVPASLAAAAAGNEKRIRMCPDTARMLFVDDAPPSTSDRLKNPYLGKTLEQIADKGPREFYEGRIAERIVKHIQEAGGVLSAEDLAEYQPRFVKPLTAECAGHTMVVPPLCSAGPSLLQMCRIAEIAQIDHWARDAARLSHAMVEILRAAWLDRYRKFGDPEQVRVDMTSVLSDVSLGALGQEIGQHINEGTRGQCLLRPFYSGGTTHISAVDKDRNAVALTLTHGPTFGSCLTIPRMGVLMNAGMSRFDPGSGLPNSIAPGKAPIHNMCPTIVMREGSPALTTGASGGTRIPSSLFQVLARRLVMDEDLEWAVSAARVHSEGNEWVMIEEEFGELAPEYLESEIGYELKTGRVAADVRAIEVTEDDELLAVLDPRLKGREKGI